MFVIDAVRKLIGAVAVETITRPRGHPLIKISGIRGDFLAKDLNYYFKTSRVAKYMFDKVTGNYVIFPAFFALEVLKIMDMIITAPRRNYVSRRTAEQIKAGLLEATWVSKILEEDYPTRLDLTQLKNFRLQPLPDQYPLLQHIDKVSYLMSLNGTILDAIMGSGKTMMGLYVLECSNADVKIVISPKNAMDRVWVNTIKNDLLVNRSIWRSDQPGFGYKDEDYMVVHYEAMSTIAPIVAKLAKQGKKIAIVVDECHNFNEIKSGRSQNLIEICKESKSETIVLQSGTPFKAIGAEIVTALFAIDPTFDENLAERFKKIYASISSEALELLKHRLGIISYKISVIPELTKPIIENFKVKSPRGNEFTLEYVAGQMAKFVSERNAYYRERKSDDERIYLRILQDFEHDFVKGSSAKAEFAAYKADVAYVRKADLRMAGEEIKRTNSYENGTIIPTLSKEDAKLFKEVKTIYKYVSLKIQGECLGRILGKARMECSVEIARSLDYARFIETSSKKSLVYTVYVQALQQAAQTLKENNYTPLVVYGDTNKNINNIIRDFEKDPKVNPLVATFHSLSTAIPLTMADVMIMIDTPFRDYIFQQTVARINRRGTTTQTHVYIAGLDTGDVPNLSTRTIDILKWSQSQVEKITGVASPFEIDEKKISVEGYAMAGEVLQDDAFVEYRFEEEFMSKLN